MIERKSCTQHKPTNGQPISLEELREVFHEIYNSVDPDELIIERLELRLDKFGIIILKGYLLDRLTELYDKGHITVFRKSDGTLVFERCNFIEPLEA